MAIEVTGIQHHPQPPFTRSTLIHAADPEPPPRVDVPSPAASSSFGRCIIRLLPPPQNQTATAPHQNILSFAQPPSITHVSPRQTLTARCLSGFTKLPNARRTSTFFFFLGQTTIVCLVTTCLDKRPIVLMPPPTPESDDGLRRMEHWLINHITATANVHDRLLACFNT